ncbi:MAG: DUF3016 domain-containing protein [Glaciecola sp.]|nr:DUF3016 domain-containing protein [Glaciecola sp.]MDG1469619.1 DUF3016 domain-containing protein [Glaciecola sp.]
MKIQSTVVSYINRSVQLSALVLSLAASSIVFGVSHASVDDHGEHDASQVSALTVTWGDYQTFTDVKPANGMRKAYAESTFKTLEEYMHKLAADLPQRHTLAMTITNLDLAGRVLPGSFTGLGLHSTDMIRVIKTIDIPRIEFTYEYKDANGIVLKSDTVNLKDMSFMTGHNPLFSSDSLKYEKNMLRKWFKDTFAK